MDTVNLNLVQLFIKGKDPSDLVRLQALNNHLNQMKYNYTPPSQLKDGSWIVWFFADLTRWQDPTRIKKGDLRIIREFESK